MQQPASRVLQPVTLEDVGVLHAMVMAAIDEALGDVPAFRAREQARFDKGYLRALVAADPGYALFAVRPDGTRAGFILSQPDQGAIVLTWCYVLPAHRKGAFALRCMMDYVRRWNNGRFHKVVTYTRPENKVIRSLMKYGGFREVAVLQQHMYGQDVVLSEHMLTKAVDGYAPPVGVGLMGRVRLKARALLSRG